MPDEGVKVVGYDELVRGTRELFDRIGNRADKDLQQVARQRAEMVRAVVPRVTGRLAGSVTAAPFSGGAEASIGDDGTPYAGWIEFGGTRGRSYVPEGRYLYPISLAAGHTVGRDLGRATSSEIRGFHWPTP